MDFLSKSALKNIIIPLPNCHQHSFVCVSQFNIFASIQISSASKYFIMSDTTYELYTHFRRAKNN